MKAVLGIDSGGTKTLAAWVSEAGDVIEVMTGPGLDPTRAEDAEADLDAVLSRFDMTLPEAATLGLGYHGEVARVTAMQTRIAAGRFGPGARACNDVEIAHIGAFAGGDGVLCLAGTGSMGWAKGPKGTARAGGFGDLIGDEGSAFHIGRRALVLLSHECDGRRDRSAFGGALARAAGLAPSELIEWTYSHANVRAGVASLARHVSALAEAGDGEAGTILRDAAADLAAIVRAAAKAAGMARPAPLACAGSVFSDAIVRGELARLLQTEPVTARLPPVGGAALDAALRAGWPVEQGWISALRDGLNQRGVA